MVFDWLAILKTPAGVALKKLLNFAGDSFARHKASEKAMQGEDLVGHASLNHLVKKELERLAKSDDLPPGLQSEEFRSWLRERDNVELFVEAFIAQAGNLTDISKQAEERLATKYEQATRETRKLAPGRIGLAVSYVSGQLMATETDRQALQLALGQRIAAQVSKLTHSEQHQIPKDADLARVKAMAATLLEAGKRSWKMPRFVAPLTLEAQVQKGDNKPHPTDTSELSSAIETGDNLVLFGSGGIGKTTFLLDLCASCLNGEVRIPLYVDAAVWARTNTNLLDYLTGLPSARANNVTSAELTRLAEAGRLVIMLNGWNEMAAAAKLTCRDGLIHLAAAAKGLSFVVVSRTSSDVPSLPNAKQVEVQGLTWQGQSAVVRAELGDDGVEPLLDLLAKDTRLRHAARSPLILRGLIAQARKSAVAESSVFDLLGAAVQAYEEDDQRHLVLSVSPVDGHQRVYLEELACFLNQRLATNCSRESALQAIHGAATWLAKLQLIGVPPNPTAVLDVLVSHHLLHLDYSLVRFAHQRFQEYFAATRLLRECSENVPPSALFCTAVNQPVWDESFVLVAGKLKGKGFFSAARAQLVKTAAVVDVGLACDLAGISALSEADDPELHKFLVTYVNALATSPLKEVRDLGVAYQIGSGLPAFAERLWPLLESEDLQTRLHTYRLNGSAVSLAQLGAGAEQRVASWPSDRQVEFVHEIADNADNYEFLVRLARSESDPGVRAAAISALFWNFPASDVPLKAWLDAPIEVQTENDVLSNIIYALEEGDVGAGVRERLQAITGKDMSDTTQLRLALALPNEVGPRGLDVIFERLRGSERHPNDASLVDIARIHAPKRLLDVAREFALQARVVPDWVGKYLREAPVEVKTDVFECAWAALQGQAFTNLSGDILGPLADSNQIERCVSSWLLHKEVERKSLTDLDHERHRQLGYVLAHAPGGDLLNVIMRRCQAASYNETAQLVDLVLKRIGHDDGSAKTANKWLPTVDEVRQLVALFGGRVETAEVPQNMVQIYLCTVASHVAPAEFGSFLLETCHRHLDAWSTFREKVDLWSKKRISSRPHYPQYGSYLSSAFARWGPNSLPGLLELMAHPGAMDFLPEVIARIVSLPWASKRERLFSDVSTDIQEGEQRRRLGRELRQPDDTYQSNTDEAAKALGQKLNERVTAFLEKKACNEKWNSREAEYSVGSLAGIVANIPSANIVEPVHCAIASGLMDTFGTVRALRGLVRQGLFISDSAVIRQLEALYEQVANEKWHDDSLRHAMGELSGLIFCVETTTLLSKPIDHYLQQWGRFSNPNEIIRLLGAIHSEASWYGLLALGRGLAEKGDESNEFTLALVSALTPQHLTDFFALVANGTFFVWCLSGWTLKRLAPSVAAVLCEATSQVETFVNACRETQSPLADTLAGEVLSTIKGREEMRQLYLLEALDAGRAVNSNMPAYQLLRSMFVHKDQINSSQYEVTPKACNELRAKLYVRAKGSGPIADGCRCLLASLECGRREDGRPDDEPRHPAPKEGLAWTDVLLPLK